MLPIDIGLVDIASQCASGLDAVRSCGVTVTASSAPLTNFSGEGGQRLDRRPTDIAQTTGIGLAADVQVANVSHVKARLPDIAVTTSPATTMNADTSRPGGLPKDVNIR